MMKRIPLPTPREVTDKEVEETARLISGREEFHAADGFVGGSTPGIYCTRKGHLYVAHYAGRLLVVDDELLGKWFGSDRDMGEGPSLNRRLRRALRDKEKLDVQDCKYEELFSIYYHDGVAGFAVARVTGAPVRRIKPPRVNMVPPGPDDV